MDMAIDEINTGMSSLCMANPFLPDLWGYMHGFRYQPARYLEGFDSIACILHELRKTILYLLKIWNKIEVP